MNKAGNEWTAVMSTADEALAISAADSALDGDDISNSLVTMDGDDRDQGQAWIHVTDRHDSVAVTTQFLERRPSDPSSEWEDVVEFSVTAAVPLSVIEIVPGDDVLPLTLTPGTFRVRASAVGRTAGTGARGDEDCDTPPGDRFDELPERYLVQAWEAPASASQVVRLSSSYALADRDPSGVDSADAGRAAAARIGADLDGATGARVLTGKAGSLELVRTLNATASEVFGYLDTGLVGWGGYAPPSGVLDESGFDIPPFDGSQPLCGQVGMLRRVRVEEVSPVRRVQRFAWILPQDGVMLVESNRRFPADDTLLTTELSEATASEGGLATTMTLRHEGLPVEWLADMERWWSLQLDLVAWHLQNR